MFRNHDVIRYQISGSTWCRHGLAVVYEHKGVEFTGALSAKDTYWGVGDKSCYDSTWLSPEELKTGVVIGNIDEFSPAKYVEPDDYADEDKFYVPIGGGSAHYWIRNGAQPKPELTCQRLKQELWNAESDLRLATSNIAYRKRLIAEHLEKYPSVHLMEKETNESV